MSIRAIRWVWGHFLPTTHKLVLLALADMADDVGHCWPSVQTVAKQCGISTRTVRRIIRDLEESKLLTSESRQREDGSRTSNLYLLSCAGVSLLSEGVTLMTGGVGILIRTARTWMSDRDPSLDPLLINHHTARPSIGPVLRIQKGIC